METKRIKIDELACDPANVRAHDGKNLDAIKGSLQRFGQQKPIVVDEKGIVIAGNGTLTAARALGWDAINIVRTELAGAEATAYAIADNRTAELAEWDDEALAKQLSALQIEDEALVEAAGFSDAELTALVDEVMGITEGSTDPDEVPDVPEEPTAQPGQIWQLGNHRLMCGDSTSAEDVAALMDGGRAQLVVTDPPYGVDYTGGITRRDRLEGDKTPDLYAPALLVAYEFTDDKAPVYLWHSDSKSAAVSAAVSAAGYERRCTIIWNKNLAQFGAIGAQYKTKHEPCYYLHKQGKPPRWFGPTNEVTVWDIARNSKNEHHPTEKPVAVMSRPLLNSSQKNDLVLDLFLGSGSTLIACEQTGRKCYGMELSPAYCDVIIKRWEDFTGQTAELVNG